jgi:hypothetical protein
MISFPPLYVCFFGRHHPRGSLPALVDVAAPRPSPLSLPFSATVAPCLPSPNPSSRMDPGTTRLKDVYRFPDAAEVEIVSRVDRK